MLFWIVLGLVIVIPVGIWIYEGTNWGDWVEGLLSGLLAFLVSSIIGTIIMLCVGVWGLKPYILEQNTEEYNLGALSTSETVEGQFAGAFFVSSGYVQGKQVFSYIRSEGDGLVLRQIDAQNAIVYQGDYEPTVEVTTYLWGNPWFVPWDSGVTYGAVLRVPEGSVSNSYEVTP